MNMYENENLLDEDRGPGTTVEATAVSDFRRRDPDAKLLEGEFLHDKEEVLPSGDLRDAPALDLDESVEVRNTKGRFICF